MIRFAREADVPEILAIYAPYILTTTYTFEYEVPSEKDFLQRFRSVTAQFPWLVWEEEGQILGYAYGSAPFDRAAYAWVCEASIYLRPEAGRKGIGKKLYFCLEQLLKAQGYRTVYALITSENINSLEFHKKMGYIFDVNFRNSGYKLGRWLGVIWMEKPLNPVENVINMPLRCQDIVDIRQINPDYLDNLSLS